MDVKKNVLPHSKAKLDLYRNYLEHYLRVLGLASFCTRINLYDIFCGTGLYEDGNPGSPLIANECIRVTHDLLNNLSRPIKPVAITVNDIEKDKISKVKELLDSNKLPECTYRYLNKDADDVLDQVASEVNSFPSTERNLIFIDPYGYSNIHKEKIYTILKNECSEIILFLPVMQMYRFTDVALTNTERTCYDNLRKFVFTFFPPDHKIRTGGVDNIFEYIHEIKEALSFQGKFYTCSHYIEREKGNYYALFFITSNIYGIEKMLEAKWTMDPIKGKGFNQKKRGLQTSLFQEEFEEHDKRKELDYLAEVLLRELVLMGQLTNNDIYRISLLNEFRPTHANTVVKQLLKKPVRINNLSGGQTQGETGFGINYENYKQGIVKIILSK